MDFLVLPQQLSTPALVVLAVVALLATFFVVAFLIPAVAHWFRLRTIRRRIAKFPPKNTVSEFKKVFSGDKKLTHLWKEFQDSLHLQREERDGQMVPRAVRSTVPAELYFNGQFVVDSRLRTEFFKHLPGLFTGIGVIGTFTGLIGGLRAFEVSENAASVRASLESLMHAVGEAFLISACAIALAMLVTFVEKLLLASLYRQTEEIAQAIDARFDSGAGEEYLSRLVKASEESASQSKILKDALVKELGELLRELTQAQIAAGKEQQGLVIESLVQASKEQLEASRQDNQELGKAIAASIQDSLREPLDTIAATVKTASGDQSAATGRMLQDVMTSFSQRLNDLFGGQIAGLSELNQQTTQSIRDAIGTLQTLVANMESSSQRSADAMALRMAEAVEKMEQRQDAMNTQSAALLEQVRHMVSTSQSDAGKQLQSSLQTIGGQLAGMLSVVSDAQQQVSEGHRTREEQLVSRTREAVVEISGSVNKLVEELSGASAKMAASVAALSESTVSSIDKMSAGAELLGTASRDFSTAGDRVSGVMNQVGAVSSKLAETSASLGRGSAAIEGLLDDYKRQRDLVGEMLTELRATVEAAKREATLTGDVLARIEGAASKLGAAQQQADSYLASVNKVLAEAHSSFATEIKRTLDKANFEFHTKLATAVGMLSSSVQNLEVTLASVGFTNPPKK